MFRQRNTGTPRGAFFVGAEHLWLLRGGRQGLLDCTADEDLSTCAGVSGLYGRESDYLAQPMTLNIKAAGTAAAQSVTTGECANRLDAQKLREDLIKNDVCLDDYIG